MSSSFVSTFLTRSRPGNVLVCWEHGVLSKIVAALGVTEPVVYPGERFDIIVSTPVQVMGAVLT